jgi:hypothetical protein
VLRNETFSSYLPRQTLSSFPAEVSPSPRHGNIPLLWPPPTRRLSGQQLCDNRGGHVCRSSLHVTTQLTFISLRDRPLSKTVGRVPLGRERKL